MLSLKAFEDILNLFPKSRGHIAFIIIELKAIFQQKFEWMSALIMEDFVWT